MDLIDNFWYLWSADNTGYHLLILVTIVVFLLYRSTKNQYDYFKKRGIKSVPFYIPYLGNTYGLLTRQEHFIDIITRMYNTFPGERYVGVMQFNEPLIMIKDLELLKQVTIKDFDHFTNHQVTVNEETDPLFGSNLFSLRGEKWRDMRATLSPAFTSSKMRHMFEFTEEIALQIVSYVEKEMKEPINKERGLIEMEMKDVFTRYTNDVIASSAFGLKVDSLNERENEFYKMGKLSSDFSGFQQIKFLLALIFPTLFRWSGLNLTRKDVQDFFISLVLGTMKNREENHIIRHDMIHLLMQAKKGSLTYDANQKNDEDAGFATVEESEVGKRIVKRKWTDTDIVAQAVLFFIAGFETSSILLCFMAHELTMNPDIQKKLQEEIDEIVSKNGKRLNYNDLAKMKYMDMVVSETLRLWPPLGAVDRQCVKPFQLPPSNETSNEPGYKIQANEGIWIPIRGFHLDPKYFPDPKKFDPERFSDENKDKIHPFSYLPFGIGPRNCIGSRFALMEVKAIIFHLLANFDFVETAKTQNPIVLKKSSGNMQAEKGFWIGLKPKN